MSFSMELPDAPPPVGALARLAGIPGRALLESAAASHGISVLAADPLTLLTAKGRDAVVQGGGASAGPSPGDPGPFGWLDALLPGRGARPSKGAGKGDGEAGLPVGGWIGYLGYEAGGLLERLPEAHPDDVGLPDLWFGAYDWCLVWERGRRGALLQGAFLPDDARGVRVRERMAAVRSLLAGEGCGPVEVLRQGPLAGPADAVGDPEPVPSGRAGGPLGPGSDAWTSLPEDAFKAGVERIRSYIRDGDLFQANLTHRISRPTLLDGPALYRRLRAASPAPYGAYLDLGGAEVASISPECFLSLRGDRVETRPIKGTAPRGSTPEEDRRLARALLASEKERAENVMIVDLLRNDLSRVCRPGSVRVPRLLELESHPTIHHLVSSVHGRLRAEVGVVDLLRATFPGGSITGAPKIRAMEILRELEPVRRGVYTGALGLVTFQGEAELSIAIRTAVLRAGVAHYGTGGGITLASEPQAEWDESLAKARAFLEATGAREAEGEESERKV